MLHDRNLLTVKEYQYADNIRIYVRTNFKTGKISLVEPRQDGTYGPKRFNFSERTIEYMQGWLNILACMKDAITLATADLKEYQEAENDIKANVVAAEDNQVNVRYPGLQE